MVDIQYIPHEHERFLEHDEQFLFNKIAKFFSSIAPVIAIVAAVVIPIAAPAIASAIGSSLGITAASVGLTATQAAAVGSALSGAALGAGTAALTGQNIGLGALGGAIGGGIGGYMQAADAAAQASQAAAQTQQAAGQLGQLAQPPVPANMTPIPQAGGFTPIPASASSALPTAGAAVSAAESAGFLDGVIKSGSKIFDRITSAEAIADATLRAGGMLLAGALTRDPMQDLSPQERELVEMRREELQQLKERDEAAFNAQLEGALKLLRQADYFDPAYFGQQAQNRALIQGAEARRDALAMIDPRDQGARDATARRADLATAEMASTAFDRGQQQGFDMQANMTRQGLAAIPNAPTSYASQLGSMFAPYDTAYQRNQQRQQGLLEAFGSFMPTSPTLPKTDVERRRQGAL